VAFWAAAPRLAAAQAGWILLGSRTINWTSGRDTMLVPRGRAVSSLALRTRGGEIFITNLELAFAQGGRERVPMNMRVRADRLSMPVRLRNRNSDIRRIEFWYRRASPGGSIRRTSLEIFGRR
jgi:hypothetical protein